MFNQIDNIDIVLILSLITIFSIINEIKSDYVRLLFFLVIGSLYLIKSLANLTKNANDGYLKYLLTSFIIIAYVYIIGCINGQISTASCIYSLALWFLLILFIISIFTKYRNSSECLELFFYSLCFFVTVNVFFYLVGFEGNYNAYGEERAIAKIPQLFGIHINRVFFPLSSGINGFGVISGLSLTISTILFFKYRERSSSNRIVIFVFLISSVFSLLATDSRGGILFSFLSILIILALIDYKKYFKYIVFIPPFAILALLILSLITYNLDVSNDIIRGNTLLSGREFIWLSAIEKIIQFPVTLISGYGLYGQTTSGVSEKYSFVFSTWNINSPNKVHLHNFFLQNLFDIGIIGMILLFMTIFKIFKYINLNKNMSYDKIIINSYLIYAVFAGTTDLTINFYRMKILLLFIVIVVYYYLSNRKNKKYLLWKIK